VRDLGPIGVLDNWWAFGVLLAVTTLIFGYILPKSKAPVFAEASPATPRRVLDEYFWTWTPDIARQFFFCIGPNGRRAYRRFYWSIDFWFPSLIASLANLSLLLLAFPGTPGLAWLTVLAFAVFRCYRLARSMTAASKLTPRRKAAGGAAAKVRRSDGAGDSAGYQWLPGLTTTPR